MSSTLATVLVGSAGGATTVSIVGGILLRFAKNAFGRISKEIVDEAIKDLKDTVDQRFDKNDSATKDNGNKTADLEKQLLREFGGNSGGMRQAISELQQGLASLSGQFQQYTKEAPK